MSKPKKYKHILVSVDLSTAAEKLIHKAQLLAKANRAKCSVVHVFAHTPIAYGGEFSIPLDVTFEQTMEKKAKARLLALGKKCKIPSSALHLKSGSVQMGVSQTAKKIKADLIVVGRHERHGLGALLGSQANAVLHSAHCDVLIVRL